MRRLSRIAPLHTSLPRVIDFLPLLSVKQELDKDLQVGYFSGEASVSRTLDKRNFTNRDHDLDINVIRGRPTSRSVRYNPQDYTNPKTLSKIFKEVEDLTGQDVPEVVEKRSFPIIPIEGGLSEREELQGLDKLGLYQVGSGIFYQRQRRRYGLTGTRNPRMIIENDMRERQLWRTEYSKRLRSLLKLRAFLGLDPEGHHKGWQEILSIPDQVLNSPQQGIIFPPLAIEICNSFTRGRWWTDVGIPRRFLASADGVEFYGCVYLLQDRRVRIPTA